MECPRKSSLAILVILACAALTAGCDSSSNPGSNSGDPGLGGAPGSSTSVTTPNPAPSGTPGSITLDSEEQDFVTLINNYRIQNNLPALQVSITLTESSQWMSADMANNNYLDHTDSLGRSFSTRILDFGYPTSAEYLGENIAAGNATAADTFTQWEDSPPHNANMLDANYAAMGVGRAYNASSEYGWYWTTDFGSVVDATLAVPASPTALK